MNSVVENQPKGASTDNQTNENDISDNAHARQDYCCCLHGWGPGPDPRWYYPWDKGVYRLMGVCCLMYCFCVFVPCMLCKKEYRDIVLCADQCGGDVKTDSGKVTHSDNEKDEIAIA